MVGRASLWLLVLMIGCGESTPAPRASARRTPNVPRGPQLFSPTSPGARLYNDPQSGRWPASPGSQIVVDLVNQAAENLDRPRPRLDARLAQACAEIGRVVLPEVATPYGLIEFELQRQGIIEPSPHLLIFWGSPDREDTQDQLRHRINDVLRSEPYTRLGVASIYRKDLSDTITVVALQKSFLITEPIPRRVNSGNMIMISGQVIPPYHDVAMFVARGNGEVESVNVDSEDRGSVKGRRFRARVSCAGLRGKQQVEITASDRRGSSVLANFPIFCGTEPPRTFKFALAPSDAPRGSSNQIEGRMLELIQDARKSAGLPPLKPEPRLAEVARAHSEDMLRNKFVAHISPTTGSASDRVGPTRLPATMVLENVARAYTAEETHDGFMNSPGHRANILARAATHVGVGVAIGTDAGRDVLFVTQLFVKLNEPADAGRVRENVAGKIARSYRANRSSMLDELAQDLAQQAARASENRQAWDEKLAARARGTFSRVATIINAVNDATDYDVEQAIGQDARFSHFGLGVAVGRHPRLGTGTLFFVILLASE